MSLIAAVYDRRIASFLARCKPITSKIILDRCCIKNIRIDNVVRLNYYITINNINYEIYGIKNNKLIDYLITNEIDINQNYINRCKKILTNANLLEYEIYVFNTNHNLVSNINIKRFDSIERKRSRNEFEGDTKFQELIENTFNYKIDQTWVSASKTRNSALNDRCLDYYDEYNISKFEDEPVKRIPQSEAKKLKRDYGEGVQQKFKDGIDFENKVVKTLFDTYGEKIIKIGESYMARDKDMCIKTFKAMYRGIPLIYQGVLQNPENHTLGSVDLLVRNDYINIITNNTYNDMESKKLESPFPHKHFYYAVDIKNTKLQFNVDNTTLRNNTCVKPFKFQLHVYNEALKYMQKVNTEKAFILGRGWKMERIVNKEKVVNQSNEFNDKLGTIDFGSKDDHIMTETDSSIKWLQELKESTNWTHRPPSNKHIYPNMCNTNDDGYRHIKQKSAEELKDITMIAYLTPEHRERAFKEGIYSWNDSKLNCELIGVTGKTGELVDAILNTNRDKSNKLVFYKSLDNSEGILNSDKLEYYIDFETIIKENVNYVYMIGLGYAHISCGWVYKCFTLDALNEISERKMYDEFIAYINNVNKSFNVDYQPLFYHWSSVEPHQLNKLVSNLKLPVNNIKWFDLYKYFRDNVITVKGAFSHSLKSIGRGMFVNKLINTFWDESSLKDNKIGILAYNKYIRKNDTGEFDDVVKYNEVDCEIMYDILNVIRGLKK